MSILDQLSGPPPTMPDPQPHLAPGGDPAAAGGGDPAGALASILAGGGPGADQGPLPVEPSSTPGGDPASHATTEIGHLKDMLGLAHAYMAIPTVEPSEAHAMSKAVSILTKILADNQQMNDQAGSSPALRKATGGGAY